MTMNAPGKLILQGGTGRVSQHLSRPDRPAGIGVPGPACGRAGWLRSAEPARGAAAPVLAGFGGPWAWERGGHHALLLPPVTCGPRAMRTRGLTPHCCRCSPLAGSRAGHPFWSGRMAAAREPRGPRVPAVASVVRLCFWKSSAHGGARPATAAAAVKLRRLRKR